MALLCLLVLLSPPPVDLAADRVEIDPQTIRATGLRLTRGDLALQTPRAIARRTARCAQGDWALRAPVEVQGPRLVAHAGEAQICLPDGHLTLTGLAIEVPGGRLAAARAEVHPTGISAEQVEATACACADPPWTVTAASASWTTGGGAWLQWPVLRLGDLPVLAAPAWYVPLARRRSGLLAPRLGFDAEDGPYGSLPLFLTLGQSADLTLAPGWRDGLFGSAQLRWAATPAEGGDLQIQSLGTTGLRAFGAGSLPLGGARLAIDGELTTDRAARQRLARTLLDRRRDHLRSAAVAHVTGELASAGLSITRLHDLRDPDGEAPWMPEVWLGWAAPVGPATLRVDGRFLALRQGDEGPVWLDLDGQLDSALWLGPLRIRPVLGAATTIRLDTDAPQVAGTWAGAEAEVLATRDFSGVRHQVGLRLDGRAAEASGARERVLPLDAPLASRAVGVSLINRLVGADVEADVLLRAGADRAQAVDVLSAHGQIAARMLRVSGSLAGLGTHWSRASFEPVAGYGLRGGHARIGAVSRLPSLWSTGIERPWLVLSEARDQTSASAGVFLAPGRLRVAYDLMVDARAERLLGQWGAVSWDGRCDCWRVGAQVSHERGRAWPDVLATVQLGPL